RELAEQRLARRRTRRLRQLLAALVVLLVLTATATLVAVRSQQTTRDQRNTAISGKVANQAAALRATNPALAAQLSLAPYRLPPPRDARGSLPSTFATPYATGLPDHTAAVYVAEFSPDGRTLVTAGVGNTIRLWNALDRHNPAALAALTGHRGTVTSAAFSPD